ncbi:unnamed protein product [Chondrus crispus]|uniref:Dickkopf N-terminal cysteine-rich domain-containing protein n=1 Tax=Chondrus crispus TaxID=2769 RepID=R7Q6Z6_CHOCR|nr:unnamed protein product [Chondrus crispus]CDF33146.1 unnamed protein product [Chondrus crispus]|eukprot:XP_005712949.1 unnamed protein product [Chondrus crispus]
MMKRTPFFMAILSFLLVLSRTQADRSDTTTLLIKSQISKNQARLHPLSRISHSKLKLKRAFTMRSGDVVGVQVRAGLTADECSSDQDCVGSRECIYLEDDEIFPCSNKSEHGKNSSSWCFCFGEEHFQICDYSHECVEGELCASIGGERPFCLSKDYVAENPGVVQTDGLTFDECEASSQCIAPRICEIVLDNDELKECNYNHDERCNCFATQLTECETDADCPGRAEICAERTDVELESFLCISKDSVRRLSFWRPAPVGGSPTPTTKPCTGSTSPPPAAPTRHQLQNCGYSYECVEGEVCASTDGTEPFCTARIFAILSANTVQTDGLTWDDCEASSQCIAPRICEIVLDNDELKECNYNHDERCNCFATQLTECETNADCPDGGEICAERTDTELESFYCISEDSVRRLSFWRAVPAGAPSPGPTF